MRILSSDSPRRVPWKNGLGSTLEIATDVVAPGREWTWRLSIADIPSRALFSAFPGIDRFIVCLSGPGLDLEWAGRHALAPRDGEALAFAGEEAVTGTPLGPGVRDVNLMLRRDRWRGRMALICGRSAELEAGQTLVTRGRVMVLGSAESVCVGCELSPVGALAKKGNAR